jgi:hypothetical protein
MVCKEYVGLMTDVSIRVRDVRDSIIEAQGAALGMEAELKWEAVENACSIAEEAIYALKNQATRDRFRAHTTAKKA